MEEQLKALLLDPAVGKLVSAALGLLLLIVIVRVLGRLLTRYIVDVNTRYQAKKFIRIIGYLTGILLLAIVFSDRLGKLAVAFGVAGAGIAFALQEVITSIAGWVAVTFGGFYKTGDRIQFGGIKGDVIDIGIVRTTLMECGEWVKADQYTGRIVRVANSFVFKEPVFNYSADFPFLWDEISVPIRYGSDPKLARDILKRIVDEVIGDYAVGARGSWKNVKSKYLIEDARIEPMVILNADENWMEFTIRYIVDYKERRSTKDNIFSRILEELDKTEGRVQIASTSTEIYLKETPTLDVDIKGQP